MREKLVVLLIRGRYRLFLQLVIVTLASLLALASFWLPQETQPTLTINGATWALQVSLLVSGWLLLNGYRVLVEKLRLRWPARLCLAPLLPFFVCWLALVLGVLVLFAIDPSEWRVAADELPMMFAVFLGLCALFGLTVAKVFLASTLLAVLVLACLDVVGRRVADSEREAVRRHEAPVGLRMKRPTRRMRRRSAPGARLARPSVCLTL